MEVLASLDPGQGDTLGAEYPETLPGPARQALGITAEGTLYPEIDQLIVKLAPLTTGTGIPVLEGPLDARIRAATDLANTPMVDACDRAAYVSFERPTNMAG